MVHPDGIPERRPRAVAGSSAALSDASVCVFRAAAGLARLPERKSIGVSTVAEFHRPIEGLIEAHQQETMAPDSCVVHIASTGKTSPGSQWVPRIGRRFNGEDAKMADPNAWRP